VSSLACRIISARKAENDCNKNGKKFHKVLI
jgi:hypothetical protein